MKAIQASLRHPVISVVLLLMAVSVGIQALLSMPRMEDPNITIRTGLVMAMYPGATSEQVEKQVTKKLEEHIFKFPEIRRQKTYSTSRPGLCIINVELEDNVKNADVFWSKLRHELNETRGSELPSEVMGPIVDSDFGDTVAMLVAVHGQRYGYRELKDYVDRIQDQLRTVRTIGKIATYGQQSEQIWITSSMDRISRYSADPVKIIQALQGRNIILHSGNLDTNSTKVPLRTTGLFSAQEQVRNTMIDVNQEGTPVYIRDVANVERRYQDPSFVIRYDGEPSILFSVEMQKGKNIVELGEEISASLAQIRPLLPPDLKLDLIANQPTVVEERMAKLGEEFLLAIGAVILVTIILLPLRVAVIAAIAIPVTMTVTIGTLNALGIQLHQVSIAAIILVLGIVVDDAIVIADNYVELLDRGVPREEAAWRSASDMFVPVLTATLTIICSFLPLLILTGSVGEFIQALPITVAVALSISFLVAILFTPILCRFFIKKGLHTGEQETQKKKFSLLDGLQVVYNRTIVFFMKRKILAMALGMAAIVSGVLLFKAVPEQFFPSAERNQFVIDVWMPEGTRIEATQEVVSRIEKYLSAQSLVAHHSSFIGQSAPRFYYNVNPQQPDFAYAQLIVNTKSEKETSALVSALRPALAGVAPEARVIVKELDQGDQMEAPVEVRIVGDDLETLKRLGSQVEDVLRAVPYSRYVHNDFYNDSYFVDVKVNEELSNRFGLTNSNISMLLAGAMDGEAVSTYWEGNRPINIVLRLDPWHRQSFEDVKNTYITSQLTHDSVPLRSMATLAPEWQTSRIVRRNGVRTLTVRAFVTQDHYASELVNATNDATKKIPLPPGYRIEYGGEKFNQEETFPDMVKALLISLVAIFVILMIQFRGLKDPLVVMASIPLSLFGAILGLVVTRNPFGFTAFMGLIALCGIVVRNGIILVDYIHEKIAEGQSLEDAATAAGERRLRPIFLTTMAAAVGVTPMILSRSSLWSPLASVLAMGLIFSMFFTLLIVPVLFVIVQSRRKEKKSGTVAATTGVAVLLLAMLAPQFAFAQLEVAVGQDRKVEVGLSQALDMALKHNRAIKISKLKIQEGEQRTKAARSDQFAQLSSDANVLGLASQNLIRIPAGSLGTIKDYGPFPSSDVKLDQGSNVLILSNVTVTQPLTQLWKIRQGIAISNAETEISRSESKKMEDDVVLAVRQLFYGLLIAQKQASALQSEIAAGESKQKESQDAVRTGNALEVVTIGSRANLLKSRQDLLAAQNQIADYSGSLVDLLGLPVDTELTVREERDSSEPLASQEEYAKSAIVANAQILSAKATVSKARGGVAAAQDEFIPEVGVFFQHTYQNGVPFLPHNNDTFGMKMTWNIFDWGKRKDTIKERQFQLQQAEENVRRLESNITIEVRKAYRKVERSKSMIEVAKEALALRQETQRLSKNQLTSGLIQQSQYDEAVAATAKAESDLLQAELGYELAIAELNNITGERP